MDSDIGGNVTAHARQVGDHPVIEAGARVGYLVNGVLHLLLGWLALQLAFGDSQASTDQSGAFATLAQNGWGKGLLIVMLAGFLLLAIWQIAEAVSRGKTFDRVKAAGKAVVYVALAVTIVQVLRGSGRSGSGQSTDFTATLMSAPLGRVLVGVVGLGVIAVAVYNAYKGLRKKFLEDLRKNPGRPAEIAGQVGYTARGVALALVGSLFIAAALNNQPGEATGMDGGLRQLLELPFGTWLLTLVAVGFILFAGYCVARARYTRV